MTARSNQSRSSPSDDLYHIPVTSGPFTGPLEDEILKPEPKPESRDGPQKKLTRCKKAGLFFKHHWNGFFAVVFPSVLALLIFVDFQGNFRVGKKFNFIWLVLVIFYYFLVEPIPNAISSMVPLILMPTLNLLDSDAVTKCYFTNDAVMVVCGTMASISLEHAGVHNRIAYGLLRMCGYRLRLLHFITMAITYVLSAVSNGIIVTAFMCPIITALLSLLGNNYRLIRIYANTDN